VLQADIQKNVSGEVAYSSMAGFSKVDIFISQRKSAKLGQSC